MRMERGELMEHHSEKIILFPKWRTVLEKESLAALKDKRYDEALMKLNQLLRYGIRNHEIVTGKLMCLMELNRHKEAQDLCEELLLQSDEHYYHYVHIYLTILFHTSQYQMLMAQVEKEFAAARVPQEMKDQFRQLYDISSKMQKEIQAEKSSEYIDALLKAVKDRNDHHQYRLVEQMRRMDNMPTSEVLALLTDDQVHPVIKTAIFIWLQETDVYEEVAISKLGVQMQLRPNHVPKLDSHPVLKQTILIINELEQENPTLFQLMEQLLIHYVYVWYPVMPSNTDPHAIARALTKIGEDYLNIHTGSIAESDERVSNYIDAIKMCEALYSSIIEA
ncbi:tetratricopeptide repeat protein [Lentibacillus cibarius]|nr:tetratricopeptide repeat protein [Lentibacillus cibarius]